MAERVISGANAVNATEVGFRSSQEHDPVECHLVRMSIAGTSGLWKRLLRTGVNGFSSRLEMDDAS